MRKTIKALLVSVSMTGICHAVGGDGQDDPIENQQNKSSLVTLQFKDEGVSVTPKKEVDLYNILISFLRRDRINTLLNEAEATNKLLSMIPELDQKRHLQNLDSHEKILLTYLNSPHIFRPQFFTEVDIILNPQEHPLDLLNKIVYMAFPVSKKYSELDLKTKDKDAILDMIKRKNDSFFSRTLKDIYTIKILPNFFFCKIDDEFLKYLKLYYNDSVYNIIEKNYKNKIDYEGYISLREKYKEAFFLYHKVHNSKDMDYFNHKMIDVTLNNVTHSIENPIFKETCMSLNQYFINLKELKLSQLFLKKVPPIKHAKLERLKVDHNLIAEEQDLNMDQITKDCGNLKEFYYSDNPVTSLPGMNKSIQNKYPGIQFIN